MRKHWLFILSLFVFVALTAAYFTAAHVSARAGEDSPLFSIRRHDPYGCAALFELLKARGTEVRSLERSLPPQGFTGTLVRAFPGAGAPVPGLQTKLTLEWVKNGGRLVMFTPEADDLLRHAFPLPEAGPETKKPAPPAGAQPDREPPPFASALPAAAPRPWSAHLLQDMAHGAHPDTVLPAPAEVRWKPAGPPWHLSLAAPMALPETFPGWSVLARVKTVKLEKGESIEQQVPVIGRLTLGKGEIVVVGDPMPMTNIGLQRGDNLRLTLGLLENHGPVLFDEFSHGLGASDRLMALIVRFGLLPVLLQGLFTGILFVWSTAGFPRPKISALPPRPRPASDQVLALGHLLAQSSQSAALLARVPKLVRRRLGAALMVPPESLVRALDKHPAGPRADALLQRADALAAATLPPHAEALALAVLSESHDLAKELAHESHPAR